jgi:hypothetical protein
LPVGVIAKYGSHQDLSEGEAVPTLTDVELEVYASAALQQTYKVEDVNGTQGVVRNYPIFRAGTFRDSLGRQRTWTRENLDDMVKNFSRLKEQLPTVPVRANHGRDVQGVIGWVIALRRKGDQLLADFQFTEAEARSKFESGTYRNRSAEIGAYETNDEEMYWPVLMGFAFVDLPAVEGLHSAHFSFAGAPSTRETPVPDEPTNSTGTATTDTTNGSGVNIHLHGAGSLAGQAVTGTPAAEPGTPAAPQVTEPVKFTLNGAETTDHARVQAHIGLLEAFREETIKSGRSAFVNALAKDNKIAATQVDGLVELTASMSDDQFELFKKGYESAPASSLFASHTAGVTNQNGGGAPGPASTSGADAPLAELEKAEAIVAMHKRAGKSVEEIKATPSGKLLAAHGKL